MYGIPPKKRKEEKPSSLTTGNINGRELELMAAIGTHATMIARQRERVAARRRTPPGPRLAVGDQVFVLKGKATTMIKKWPTDKLKFYCPCRVVNARHPRYTLGSAKARFSRRAIHARRLVPFIQKPSHLI